VESASNRTACSEIADHEWLTGDEAAGLAAEIAPSDEPPHRVIEQLRRRVSPERARLVFELVELRRRASAKFTEADRMFFTRLGLEQASDEWVAAYKAARFPAGAPVADLCCGIGGDLLALARRGSVVGVDRDPMVAHFANANVSALLAPVDSAIAKTSVTDVEGFALNAFAAWHIDPDRRPTGSRTTSANWSSPNRATIERLLAIVPHAAIKLAPGAIVPQEWVGDCELEWISRDGECRQLVAWHGDLAKAVGKRRATTISISGGSPTVRSLTGDPNQATAIVHAPDRFVFDCDPAVLAAHLKGALAAEHGLFALGTGPTYLTGSQSIDDPAVACFEVLDVLPLKAAVIAQQLRERGIGALEIKKRGVDIEPESLRRSLKLLGNNPAVLLITPIAGRPAAIFAQRVARHCRP
jgi:hypothetical protein